MTPESIHPSATEDVVVTLPTGEIVTRLANGLTWEERIECERLERLFAASVNGKADCTPEDAGALLALYRKLEDFKKSPEFRRNKARRDRRRNR